MEKWELTILALAAGEIKDAALVEFGIHLVQKYDVAPVMRALQKLLEENPDLDEKASQDKDLVEAIEQCADSKRSHKERIGILKEAQKERGGDAEGLEFKMAEDEDDDLPN